MVDVQAALAAIEALPDADKEVPVNLQFNCIHQLRQMPQLKMLSNQLRLKPLQPGQMARLKMLLKRQVPLNKKKPPP